MPHTRNSQRHSWGDPNRIPSALALPRKTERTCTRCLIVKVVWHDFDGVRETYRTEFYRGLERVEGVGTPVCEAVEVEA